MTKDGGHHRSFASHVGLVLTLSRQHHPYAVLLTLAFMCGIAAGASPATCPLPVTLPCAFLGTALGLQSGIGNLGMSVIQLVPILMDTVFRFDLLAPSDLGGRRDAGEQILGVQRRNLLVPWCAIAAILPSSTCGCSVKANIK